MRFISRHRKRREATPSILDHGLGLLRRYTPRNDE